jgi:hypothetical protein
MAQQSVEDGLAISAGTVCGSPETVMVQVMALS